MNLISTRKESQHHLRKVAILVTTLGEPLAEQLLADLPAREAAAVREMVADLDDVPADEYEAVVADFRMGIAASPAPPRQRQTEVDGVEIDPSLLARINSAEESLGPSQQTAQDTSFWKSLSDADTEILVELLSAEQPQTVAVVLSKLESKQSAELVAKFAPPLQAEVLSRLADLDPADERALQVVESQLGEWINAQRQRRQRMAAGHDLVQRILQETPSSQRSTLMKQLGERNPSLAKKLTSAGQASVPTSTSRIAIPAVTRAYVESANDGPQKNTERTTSLPVSHSTAESVDPMSELEALDDQALLTGLRHADRQTVMLALAGASDSLMKRIVRGLPRRQANQFRQQVRAIGPTRLSDMVTAQRELVRCSQL